jgi:hypothetical protein
LQSDTHFFGTAAAAFDAGFGAALADTFTTGAAFNTTGAIA